MYALWVRNHGMWWFWSYGKLKDVQSGKATLEKLGRVAGISEGFSGKVT